MDKLLSLSLILACLILLISCENKPEPEQNWTHFVRIAGHGVSLDRIDSIIESATKTHVFGIEIDNSLTGYYESFLNPEEKLQAITAFAQKAHEAGNYGFIYTEGLETITADADKKEHTFFKDHPDWVQRNIKGEPAVFGGGSAFWISQGEEDVWISPYAPEWRKLYMERMRQLAATGIDGVYIDIPYWMTHFDGWEDTWAGFDDYTVAAFAEKTGINAKTDIKIGDFSDPNFIKWIDFRIESLTDFMREVDENVKSVNPQCKTIAEIYPGIEESAVRVGSDVYDMYPVVDVIAHEYSGGGGNSAAKNPWDWFSYMTGMYTFRAFAENKASWMLTYSWDPRQENIEPGEAMKNLALANVMAGTNCWDAARHVMSGSNDTTTREEIFRWIADHEKTFYLPRKTINPIGVYFSPQTRNYFVKDFIASYKGIMYMMLQSHQEFQIVTPRTLSDFKGAGLILPDVKCLSDHEITLLEKYVSSGKFLMLTAESGAYDTNRNRRSENPLHNRLGIEDQSKRTVSSQKIIFTHLPECPGKKYFSSLRDPFNQSAWLGAAEETHIMAHLDEFTTEIKRFGFKAAVEITASPFVSTQISRINGKIHIFFANFKGLKRNENARQLIEENMLIKIPAEKGTKIWALPYLGRVRELPAEWKDGKKSVIIPELSKGMVVWAE